MKQALKVSSSFRTEVGQEKVEVFANKTGAWEALGNQLTNPTESELFGSSISLNLDGSILAIGSLDMKMEKGVYEYIDSTERTSGSK